MVGLFYVLNVISAIRDGAAWAAETLVLAAVVFVVGLGFGHGSGYSQSVAEGIGVFAAAIAFHLIPKRSRHIPVSVRRKVVARHLENGGTFDPKEHHIDHIMSFSRGGSHTVDNLRVVPKEESEERGEDAVRHGLALIG